MLCLKHKNSDRLSRTNKVKWFKSYLKSLKSDLNDFSF